MKRTWRIIDRWFPWLATLAVGVGIVIALRSQWPAISTIDWSSSWRYIAVGALCFSAAPLAQALSFWLVLRLLGARAPLGDALRIWSWSYVLRYAPSGALAVVYRVREKERLRATRDQVLAAEAYEHLGALTAGAAASLLGFAALLAPPPVIGLAVAVPVLALAVAVRPAFAGRLVQRWLRRVRVDAPLLRGRHLALVAALNLIAWVGTGVGFLVLANGLSEVRSPGLAWAVATYAIGYLVGFVVPFLPGGLGAREGTLVALLGARYGLGIATALSLVLRLAVTLGELLAITILTLCTSVMRARDALLRAKPVLREAEA